MASGELVPSPEMPFGPTPWWWRVALFAAVTLVGSTAFLLRDTIGLQGQSAVGFLCLIGLAACFSRNLRAVNWRTIFCGVGLQLLLGILLLKWHVNGLEHLGIPNGFRPVYAIFQAIGEAVKYFMEFSNAGAKFVFGPLSNPAIVKDGFHLASFNDAVIVAFTVLPPIVFISSFFSVLYYFGILQFIVRLMARVMMYLMRTSGAETLSVSANVFMGQTEAPLTIKPYIARMTPSELLTMMTGGMAHISGSLLVVYAEFGADRVALLATSVMAAPCSLYLSKLVMPETRVPETSGLLRVSDEQPHANAIDAAAAGASDGMKLAINVAAMLIAFLALLAMINFLLGRLATGQMLWQTLQDDQGWVKVRDLLLVAGGFVALLVLLNRILIQTGRPPVHKYFGSAPTSRAANFLGVLVLLVLYVLGLNFLLAGLPEHLQLKHIFSWVFAPLAFLIGVPEADIPYIADLLGTKIAANEFLAFTELKNLRPMNGPALISNRSLILASYALTGFANFGSVGIQIGGIGAMAPARRADLARLGMTALFVGFLVTLINAAVAGLLSDLAAVPDNMLPAAG